MPEPEPIRTTPPRFGELVELLDGIGWVRMPLPFKLDHVNCWLLREGSITEAQASADQRVDDGLTLVDTAVATDEVRHLWRKVLGDRCPGRLLVTHFHPDHAGLAGSFAEQGATLLGSEIEIGIARRIHVVDDREAGRSYADWYREHGLASDVVEAAVRRGNGYRRLVDAIPTPWRWLQGGDTLQLGGREYEVLVGRGHAPAMLMLYCASERVLIAADQILPSITPNVSRHPSVPRDNPLADFLESLEALRDLPADTRVLPSHGLPFTGLHSRIDALIDHHRERLDQIETACREPVTAAELFPLLFRRTLDAQQMSFALGETLAHLHYLEAEGRVVAALDHSTPRRWTSARCGA